MRRLEFHTSGLTKDELSRWRQLGRPSSHIPAIGWLAAIVVALHTLNARAPRNENGSLPPCARLEGRPASFRDSYVSGSSLLTLTRLKSTFEVVTSPSNEAGQLLMEGLSLKSFSFLELSLVNSDDAACSVPVRRVKPLAFQVPEQDTLAGSAVVLVFDNSGSMSTNDSTYRRVRAGHEFIRALHKRDRIAVMDFAGHHRWLLRTFSSNRDTLGAAVDGVQDTLRSDTHLFDAVWEAIQALHMEDARARAIVVLTDGESKGDLRSPQEVQKEASRANVAIFPVGLGNSVDSLQLQDMAVGTGGTFATVEGAADLADAFRRHAASITRGKIVLTAEARFRLPDLPDGTYLLQGRLETRAAEGMDTTEVSIPVDIRGHDESRE